MAVFSWIAAAASIALVSGCTQPLAPSEPVAAPSPEPAVVDGRLAESDTALAELVDATQPGCSAAVAFRGDVVWTGAAGLADVAAGVPLTTEMRFEMASVAKQFTATAILLLQRDGVLSLDQPVGAYIAGLPSWGTTVTLEQLMHHTSHVPDYWKPLDEAGIEFTDAASHDDIIRAIARSRTLEPGEGYLYSNSNYVLLAEVVARVSGQALPEFLQQRVFGPLGLAMVVSPSLLAPDVPLSYTIDGVVVNSGWTSYGASGIYTTPTELARWADEYREGDMILGDFANGAVEIADGRFYAAGISIEADLSLRHDGRWGGHTTRFTISPDRETAIVVMCNGHAANRFGLSDELWRIWGSST